MARAQDREAIIEQMNSNTKMYREVTFDTGASTVLFSDNPVGHLVEDNENLYNNSSGILPTAISILADELFSHGIAFFKNGAFLKPTAQTKSIFDAYWELLPTKILKFWMLHGVIVFYIYISPEGVSVPDVPAYSQITLTRGHDQKTGTFTQTAVWNNKQIKSILYVSSVGLTSYNDHNGGAPVDAVKELLLAYDILMRSKIVATHKAARPRIPLEILSKERSSIAGDDGVMPVQTQEELAFRYDDIVATNVINANMIHQEGMNAQRRNYARDFHCVVNPAARTRVDIDEPLEQTYIRIPQPFTIGQYTHPLALTDIPDMLRGLVERIYEVLGVRHKAHRKTNVRVAGDDDMEVSRNAYRNNIRTIARRFTPILTSIFNLCYSHVSIQIADAKTTYGEQRKTKLSEQLTSDSMFNADSDEQAIRVMLVSHAISDLKQAEKLYQQGFISSEVLHDNHPQLLNNIRDNTNIKPDINETIDE